MKLTEFYTVIAKLRNSKMAEKEQAFVSGVSSRRSACDRCRSQKLRCPREQPERGSCDRCTRAQARCITSPIFRMCSQATAKDMGVQKRRRYDYSALTIRTPSLVENLPISMASPLTAEVGSTLSWNDWSYLDLSAPIINNTTSTTDDITWDTAQAAFGDLTSTEDDDAISLAYLANNTSTLDFSTPFTVQSPLSLSSSSTSYADASEPLHLVKENTCHLESSRNSSSTTSKYELRDTDRHIGLIYTKRLYSISSDLITQSALLSQDDTSMNLGMLVLPPPEDSTNPVIEIIRIICEFLRVINGCVDQALRATMETSPEAAISLAESNSSVSAPGDSLPQKNPTINTLNGGGFDPAALLLVLTCYIHLLRAYVILFEKICSFLQQVVDENGSHLQSVPGISFGHLQIGK